MNFIDEYQKSIASAIQDQMQPLARNLLDARFTTLEQTQTASGSFNALKFVLESWADLIKRYAEITEEPAQSLDSFNDFLSSEINQKIKEINVLNHQNQGFQSGLSDVRVSLNDVKIRFEEKMNKGLTASLDSSNDKGAADEQN